VTAPAILLEVIVQSVADACEAYAGGADRLEVVRAIREGGLTPPLTLVRAIASEVPLPLRLMVRENSGYDTNDHELSLMRKTAAEFEAIGVDGLVVGFARGGSIALDEVERLLQAAPTARITYHRAFDTLRDPLCAIDELVEIGAVDRILTSGGDAPPAMRCNRLCEYAQRAGSSIRIVAGGGVDEQMLALVAQTGCVREVHVGRAARRRGEPDATVVADRVRRLRSIIG
jgi:copper homeostasis protein